MNINIEIKKRHLVFVFALLLIGIAYAAVDESMPWHSAHQVKMDNGEDLETAFSDLQSKVDTIAPFIIEDILTTSFDGRVTITSRYFSGGSNNWCYFKAYIGEEKILDTHSIGHHTLTCDKAFQDIKSQVYNHFNNVWKDENKLTFEGKNYIPKIQGYTRGTCPSNRCPGATFSVIYEEEIEE